MNQRIKHWHQTLNQEGVNYLITTQGGKILIIMGSFVHGHVRTEPSEDSEYIWEKVYPDIRSIRKRSYGECIQFRGINGEKIL